MRRRRVLLALLFLGLPLAGLGWVHAERNVHRVTLHPGETTFLTVEVRMRRGLGSREYVRYMKQPVDCALSAAPDGGIWMTVVETGHGISKMWARLAIKADARAAPGRYRRDAAFTISGVGDWPEATIIVRVKPAPDDEAPG